MSYSITELVKLESYLHVQQDEIYDYIRIQIPNCKQVVSVLVMEDVFEIRYVKPKGILGWFRPKKKVVTPNIQHISYFPHNFYTKGDYLYVFPFEDTGSGRMFKGQLLITALILEAPHKKL